MTDNKGKAETQSVLQEHDYDADDYEESKNYSGRSMFGRISSYAIVIKAGPQSDVGKALMKLGMRVDNMGFEFVYYYH